LNLALLILPGLIAAGLSFALTPLARRISLRVGAIDRPSLRKVHVGEVPRLGGLAVIASVLIVLLLLYFSNISRFQNLVGNLSSGLLLGFIPIFLVSLRDDIKPLRAAPKFAAQFLGAGLAVLAGVRLGTDIHLFGSSVHLGWVAIPISILWIAGVTNAFNLVDGLDGLSAGLALISALSLAGVSILVGRYELSVAALVIAGALIGFLPYNMYPAKIFLGDSGATAIGFYLACLTLRGGSTLTAGMAILVPLVVLGLPLAETLISMVRRAVRKVGGKHVGIFEADRGHIHHRLLALGLDHRRAVLTLYGVGLLLAAGGFGSLFLTYRKAALLLGTMVVAAFVGVARLGYDEFAVVRSHTVLKVYEVPVMKRALFVVFLDLAMVVASLYGAFVLKYDDWLLTQNRVAAQWMLAVLPAIALIVFFSFGLYRRNWRLATVSDLLRASTGVFVAASFSAVITHIFSKIDLPWTFFIVYMLILMMCIDGVRASFRLLQHWSFQSEQEGDPVVIYGAGVGGSLVVREAVSNREVYMMPVGFIDDDPTKTGKFLNGYPVLGSIQELESVISRGVVKGLVVASHKIPVERLEEAARVCERTGIWMRYFRMEFSLAVSGSPPE